MVGMNGSFNENQTAAREPRAGMREMVMRSSGVDTARRPAAAMIV
jgi:hypothetical protein